MLLKKARRRRDDDGCWRRKEKEQAKKAGEGGWSNPFDEEILNELIESAVVFEKIKRLEKAKDISSFPGDGDDDGDGDT